MEEFFYDKKGDKIYLEADDNLGIIYAYFNGKQIGLFDYDKSEYGDDYSYSTSYSLNTMNIDNKFQRRGIGTKMIELGEKFFEKVSYPSPFAGRDEAHYGDEGLQFIYSCIDKGVIDKQKIFPEED